MYGAHSQVAKQVEMKTWRPPKGPSDHDETATVTSPTAVAAATTTLSVTDDISRSYLADSTAAVCCEEGLLEEVLLEDEYNVHDTSVDALIATTDGPSTDTNSELVSCGTKEFRIAKREMLTAMETFDQTRKVIEDEQAAAMKAEKELQKLVKQLQSELLQLFELQSTGIHVGNKYTSVKNRVETEERRLDLLKENNGILYAQFRLLEEALVSSLQDKERRLLELTQTSAERELDVIKREMLQLRQAAYERGLSAATAREKALSAAAGSEALMQWEDATVASASAKACWYRVLSIAKFGLLKAPEEEKGWWERASEAIKNALYTETVAFQWITARKLEGIFYTNDLLLEPDNVRGCSDDALRDRWREHLVRATETAGAWHHVAQLFREYIHDVDEVFESWWSEKLQCSEDVERVWAEVADTIDDFVFAPRDVGKDVEANVRANADSYSFSQFNYCNSADIFFIKMASLKTRLLRQKFNWDDCDPSRCCDEVDIDPSHHLSTNIGENVSSDFRRPEARDHKLWRSDSNVYNTMSEDMKARQDMALDGCFGAADASRANLLKYYEQRGAVSVTALGKVAHTISLNNAAIRKYKEMVRFEAIEDAKLSLEEARLRREDWKKRITADSLAVFETRMIFTRKSRGDSYLERITAKRNYLRAKAVLQADEVAFNAAWSVKLTDTVKRLLDVV
jgi:hypothetical protein